MKKYKEFEEEVFRWFMKKHEADPTFTFSVRQKANKGAETDYFIGTENSNYFGTTFWYIPVYFPGSSTDLINLMFNISPAGYNYHIQFNQTNTPPDQQNQTALDLIVVLRAEAKKIFPSTYENGAGKKMSFFQLNSHKHIYDSIADMLTDVDEDLNKLMPLTDAAIASFKLKNPEFRAGRYSKDDFDHMLAKLKKRRVAYSQTPTTRPFPIELPNQAISDAEDEEYFPLNQILYGPPGTGKTFNTINKAVDIANPSFITETATRESIHEEFDRLVENKFIRFCTFHQSMAYEDFIEGIKPVYDTEKQELTYPIIPGIFKNICYDALASTHMANVERTEEVNFDMLWKGFIREIQNSYTADSFPFETKEKSELRPDKAELDKGRIVAYYRWSNTSTKTDAGKTPFPIDPEKIKKMYEADITESETNLKQRLKSIMTYHFSTYYAVYKSFLLYVKSGLGEGLAAVKNKEDLYEDSIDLGGYLGQLSILRRQKKALKKGAPYVLIIDEINRGNVSQVFGELITLLEEDKRFGKNEGLITVLPYSRTDFAVPDNLYIIGTMNTADRSVEALDTALRRRFVFEEMMPDTTLLHPKVLLENFRINYSTISNDIDNTTEITDRSIEGSFYGMIGYDKATDVFLETAGEDEQITALSPATSAEQDRAHLDTAIRLDLMLQHINARIGKLLSKDQQIGHAFFINAISIQEVYAVFYQKLIPQLQEYFYGDFGKVGLILGKSFIGYDSSSVAFADFEYEDSDLLQQRKIYEIINFKRNEIVDWAAFSSAVRHIYLPGTAQKK